MQEKAGVVMAELSEEDLALIHALQIAPRVAWTDAAPVLGAHATSLAARWERLKSQGAAWVTGHMMGDPQQTSLAFIDLDCRMERRIEVVAALMAVPQIVTVERAASNRDLMLTVITDSLQELAESVIPRLAAVPGVTKFQTSLCTRLHSGGYAWRLSVLNRSQQLQFQALAHVPSVSGPLPESHLPLLPLLAADGRATAAQLARALDRTPATVQRQLNRVIAANVLSFRCEVAQRYSGFPVTCQWFARVPAGAHGQAAAALARMPSVRLSASTTGRTNFLITMWLRSVADVMDMELTLQQNIPGIELMESVIMLEANKRVGWFLNPDTTASHALPAPAPGT
jgi:DNA-binding Lrp family transcriptional regulator